MPRRKGAPPNIHGRPDRRVYEASIWIGGRRHRPQLATFEEVHQLGEREGAKLLEARYHEAMERLLTESPPAGEAAGSTRLSAAWGAFLKAFSATRSEGTRAYYERTRDELLHAVGDPPVGKLSLRDVDAFVAALRSPRPRLDGEPAPPLSVASVNIRLQVLKAFVRWAADREYISRPLHFRLLPREHRLPRVPEVADLRRLLERLKSPEDQTSKLFYPLHLRALMVALGTGMRRSEVFYLRWEHVDFRANVIHVRFQTRFAIKERREKNPPMPPFLSRFLKAEHRAASAKEVWLLDDGKGELAFHGPNALTLAFSRHYDALEIPAARRPKAFHGFRALYVTRLHNELGVDVATIARLAGHSDTKVTQGYLAATDAQDWRAVQALELPGATKRATRKSTPAARPRRQRVRAGRG